MPDFKLEKETDEDGNVIKTTVLHGVASTSTKEEKKETKESKEPEKGKEKTN